MDVRSSQPASGSTHPRLVGRDREVKELDQFVSAAAVRGGTLLVIGDAGIGKTALLDRAAAHAVASGTRVIRTAGAEFEAGVGLAGVQQLLTTLEDGLAALDAAHRTALEVVLGLGTGTTPDQLLIANAIRALLLHAAFAAPLLVVVDDLQWLDRPSATLLGIVARRLEGSRVGFLGGLRTGEDSYFNSVGLPEIEIGPLGQDDASRVLAEFFPQLPPRRRQSVLAESEGNPLALLELPNATARSPLAAVTTAASVSRRLQATFAQRIMVLPPQSRHRLLVAALAGTGDLDLRSGERDVAGLADLEPAEAARLVRVDVTSRRLQFRHPLARAAVVELSTSQQQRAAHRELAGRLPADSPRHAWHLAQATLGPDAEIAALLERASERSQRQGDPVGSINLLLRAAELSPSNDERNRRTMVAAYLGVDITGDLSDARELIATATATTGQSLAGAVAAAALMLNGAGDTVSIHRLLLNAINGAPDPTDAEAFTVIEALYVLQATSAFAARPGLPGRMREALARLRPEPPEFLVLIADTFVEPARHAHGTLGQLDAAIAAIGGHSDPAHIVRLGIAATFVDRLAACRSALEEVLAHGRSGGAITSAIEAFVLLSYEALSSGDWLRAEELATEGRDLAEKHHYKLLGGLLAYPLAYIAAARGEDDTVRSLTDRLISWATPNRIGYLLHHAAHAKSLAALGRGDHEAAFLHASAISPAGTVADHAPQALWSILELVEAGVRSGRIGEATAHVDALRRARIQQLSPRLDLVVTGAAAMVAGPDTFRELFERALAVPDAGRWPFDHARIQLAYGERLRRARSNTEARPHLDAALDTFLRLDAKPWAKRALNELRATGRRSATTAMSAAVASLTPQQLEIARLAAAGLTNKQIGEQLFLSPRTVATHLYQSFPKLGVTSRAGLRDALDRDP